MCFAVVVAELDGYPASAGSAAVDLAPGDCWAPVDSSAAGSATVVGSVRLGCGYWAPHDCLVRSWRSVVAGWAAR